MDETVPATTATVTAAPAPAPAFHAPAAPASVAVPAPASVPALAPAPIAAGWRDALAAWLAAHRTYPEAARRDGIEGRVLIRFTVRRDGSLAALALARGSGAPVLDEAALAMLREGRLPPFPPGMTQAEITVTVPVRYELRGN